MSTAGRRILAMALVVFLLARPASALIPDPVEAGLLAKIVATLKLIEEFRMRVLEKLQDQVFNRLHAYAFPPRLFDPIRATTTAVLDVRRELQRMACPWPMSARTRSLSDLLWERTRFCRSGYQDVWGSHEIFWDGPLQEAHDYVATMTANMISERAEKTNTSWVRAHRDLFDRHAILQKSPGEANHAEAAGLAWANEVALGNGQIVTQNLLVKQMARDMERFDDKKAADLTYYAYKGLTSLAGRDWRGAPPEPLLEAGR